MLHTVSNKLVLTLTLFFVLLPVFESHTISLYIQFRLLFAHPEEIKDVGHAWDKSNRPEGWEAERKREAYSLVLDFLSGVYGTPAH